MNNKRFQKILDLMVEISNEKDHLLLLEKILIESMAISNCDAGTLYIEKDGKLEFSLMKTNSLDIYRGTKGDTIELPPVEINENSVCGYCALTGNIIQVSDVNNDPTFKWDGPMKYDKMTGYKTVSLLVVPLIDKENTLIGVLQLINAMDPESGEIVPFDDEIKHIIQSIGAQAAVILSNMLLLKNVQGLLDSFVSAMTTAIDSRTPYNANHTKKVAKLCGEFMDYLMQNNLMPFTEHDKEELVMAAMLHDVGKMAIPISILNKASRLENRIELIEMRAKLICYVLKLNLEQGKMTESEYKSERLFVIEALEFLRGLNTPCDVDDYKYNRLLEIVDKEYDSEFGSLKLLSEEEFIHASIRKGTLTEEERRGIENHVVYTSKILDRIEFGKKYEHVPFIAGAHHEYINGMGYPNHLKGDEIPLQVRIITIMDVFESLTSNERPYKKPMGIDKAYMILCEMAEEGKLDRKLVELFKGYIGL